MRDSVRLLLEHRRREGFERALGRLLLELQLGTPRRHLDTLAELAEVYLSGCEKSLLSSSLRAQLAEARAKVETRRNLRLVKAVPR